MLIVASAPATPATPNFILPNGTVVVELLLFVIVLGIVNSLVLKPVQRVLDERERRIATAQHAGAESLLEAQRLDTERRAVLDSARLQARDLLEEAARSAEELRGESRRAAQEEHDRRLAEAVGEIEAQRAGLRSEVLSRVEELVGDAASRVVGVHVDPSLHRELIDAAINASSSAEGSA